MNFYKITRAAFLALTITLLAACGGSDGDDNGGSDNGGGGNSTTANVNRNIPTDDELAVTRLEFPHVSTLTNSKVIVYRTSDVKYDKDGVNFSVEWDRDKKAQRWTCYILTKNNKTKNASRYYGDRNVSQASSTAAYPFDLANLQQDDYYWQSQGGMVKDYFSGTGFDHGHICPSNDRLYSSAANYQTFYMTNMQPQYSVFNGSAQEHKYSGLWINMENFINASTNTSVHMTNMVDGDTLFVCKGGTIEATAACQDPIIEKRSTGLIVPKYYFMAILCKKSGQYKALAFWIEHKASNDTGNALAKYVVNIDELEEKTGIDFFCNLPDETEKRVESNSADNIKRAFGFK